MLPVLFFIAIDWAGVTITSATVWFMLAPDLTYRIQTKFFPIPREKFNVIIYAFLGVFKIFILVFNIAPYVALLIIG